MSSTTTSLCWATTQWASSWTSTEPKTATIHNRPAASEWTPVPW